jgi:hypothetical protein
MKSSALAGFGHTFSTANVWASNPLLGGCTGLIGIVTWPTWGCGKCVSRGWSVKMGL